MVSEVVTSIGSSGIDESFTVHAHTSSARGRSRRSARAVVGVERLQPRAVTLDPLVGSDDPVLHELAHVGRDVAQCGEGFAGSDVARPRRELEVEGWAAGKPVGGHDLDASKRRSHVFDGLTRFADDRHRHGVAGQQLAHRVVERRRRRSGQVHPVHDGGDRLLQRRRALGERRRAGDVDALR